MNNFKHCRYSIFIATIAVSCPAFSEVFIAPFTGYSFAASELDASQLNSQNQNQLTIDESSHFGLMLGTSVDRTGNIYLLYSSQNTELTGGESFSSETFGDLSVNYLHFGGSLHFPDGNISPYVTTSIGVTLMRPSGSYSDESRFSMALGAGFDYQLTQTISLFADARGYATFVNSDNSLFCNNNQCLWNIEADIMWQAQVNAGLKFKF